MDRIVIENCTSLQGKSKSHNKTLFIFFLILLVLTMHTSFITSWFLGNCAAANISQAEYTSILSVGIADPQQENSFSPLNNSSPEKTISGNEGSNVRDTIRTTNTSDTSVHRTYLNFVHTLIARFPHFAQFLSFLNLNNQRGAEWHVTT